MKTVNPQLEHMLTSWMFSAYFEMVVHNVTKENVRAIMKDTPIIILGEATANVDLENERDLLQAIEALTREKTSL